MSARSIALIGYGEVGQILAEDLHQRGFGEVSVWDILFADPTSAPSRAARAAGVHVAGSAADAVKNADLVICAVTAANDVAATAAAAPGLATNAWYLDVNSTSPDVRRQAADLVLARAGRYVEAAVMSPISPKRIATSMLLGGPYAEQFLDFGMQLGFTGTRFFSPDIGKASAAKMCRSVVVKGMEALLGESMLAARRYGVEQTVLDSLQDLFPGSDWETKARYMISRSLVHGRRRAEEMQQAALTVKAAGIEPQTW